MQTASIEMNRLNRSFVIVGLHPGTVKTNLSHPFTKSIQKTIFTPNESVELMYNNVLSTLTPEDSGKLFSYTGEEISP